MRLILHSLHTHPVKSLHGLSMRELLLCPWGPENDRRWMIVDHAGQFITQRKYPVMATLHVTVTMEGLRLSHDGQPELMVKRPAEPAHPVMVTVWKDTVQALDAGDEAAQWLSDAIGLPCRLIYMPHPEHDRRRQWQDLAFTNSFSDGFPILVTTLASLDDLNSRLAAPVPMDRFRPNLVVSGAEAWEEDRWAKIRIGGAELSLVKPCSRCVMTTVDQDTGVIPDRKEPLATLALFRKQEGGVMFGQNALVEQTGTVSVGDEVEILEMQPSSFERSGSL
ncbi:MOSC domain-containing protein [Acetobacter aceti]|uniref:MOSC domain-containing protein n=1 Tax=Acetobacter aceti TaxID=435 RepID=UPI001626F60D|nr:MOSC N-terminal beta barrel domain-containing protein [Acetobacter aceti]